MKRKNPPVGLCALLLVLALCWRMIGAPVTAEQFGEMQFSIRQARTQLPVRLARIWRLWMPVSKGEEMQTMSEKASKAEPMVENGKETRILVYLADEKRIAEMTLEGYVCGVVAAEMPAQYHLEALKAQAVAARTRALWQKARGGCEKYPGADICTDSAHCQGYASLAQCRAQWENSYEAYRDRILQAQRATAGQVLTYDGELITVLYHAISGGRTEDAATVFSQKLPYLVSVESTGEETARGFLEETRISYEEISEQINKAFQMNTTAQDVQRTLSICSYTDTGRVKSLQLAGREILAVDFRSCLGLRSTWFSISTDEKGVVFQQKGYGHGVGMSQVGANSMASYGSSYEAVLLHYYPGTVLQTR